MALPPLLDRADISTRLKLIFPEGTPERDKCIRDAAAATVAAFLYIGAVEGADIWANPVHVVRMGDSRMLFAADDAARAAYAKAATAMGNRWYQDNSREQVRDEVIRQGLIPNGAIIERPGVPTTSSKPRYALAASFAALFAPALAGDALADAAAAWAQATLNAAARARINSLRVSTDHDGEEVLVRFPNRETRLLAPGPSSQIAKAVVEEFAPRFLADPVVLWLSESAAKVAARDEGWIKRLGLRITPDRTLPDLILLDRGRSADDLMLVFVEVVATDGPVTEQRALAFVEIAREGGFPPSQVACVTAFLDRSRPEVKKALPSLAWGGQVWFASEPERLMRLSPAPGRLQGFGTE
ncbi:BsuBI/PstI family type II restriction endonuclease [Niveispirillum irakense]|uniref:BsuBI/PstI family type II restriction endonuclease n=1 Tax=Niveispirillum irakense TaxID=34011 RepID=UPI00041E3EA6|nr:BsuBI/PstI family type II restriction endonuclease [Niveispirillum irakense]